MTWHNFIVCFAEFGLVADVTSFGTMFHSLVASFTHALIDKLLYPVSISFSNVQDLVTVDVTFADFFQLSVGNFSGLMLSRFLKVLFGHSFGLLKEFPSFLVKSWFQLCHSALFHSRISSSKFSFLIVLVTLFLSPLYVFHWLMPILSYFSLCFSLSWGPSLCLKVQICSLT